MNRTSEREEQKAATGTETPPPRPMWPLAILVFIVFYLAEPHSWRFSASDAMHLGNSDESIQERVQYNIAKNQSRKYEAADRCGLAGRLRSVLPAGWRGTQAPRAGSTRLGRPGLPRLGRCQPAVVHRSARHSAEADGLRPALRVGPGARRRYSLEELAQLTMWVTGFMMAGGVACELGLGSFQPWRDDYRFSGLTWPAFTCWNASLFVIAGLTLTRGGRSWHRLAITALGTTLALLTKTRAGAAALVLAVLIHVSSTWSAAAKVLLAVGTGLALSLTLLVVSFSDVDVSRLLVRAVNLGREESAHGFSGRAGVWGMLLPYILERPLRGYGYESFWTERHLREIGERNWGAPDAHNGYINLTLGVGLVGAGLYAVALLLAMLRSRSDFVRSLHSHDLYPACVTFITAVNALCVASQLSPHVMSFASIVVFARLGFVQDDRPAAEDRVAPQRTISTLDDWQPAEQVGRPL